MTPVRTRFAWHWVGGALVLAFASVAHADVVELDTGERVTGDLKEANLEKVIIDVKGRLTSYDRARVRAIFLTPPPPRAAEPALSPAEALAALKQLQAFVSAQSRSLPDYTAQVAQSRIPVETYLNAAPADAPVRPSMADALALYEFVAKVWESRLTNSASASAANGRNAIIDRCASLQRIMAGYPAATSQENAWRRGVALEFEIPSIWVCASEKVGEAEAAATKAAQAPAPR